MSKLNHIHIKLISAVLIVPALLSLSVPVSTASAHRKRIRIHRVAHHHHARTNHRHHKRARKYHSKHSKKSVKYNRRNKKHNKEHRRYKSVSTTNSNDNWFNENQVNNSKAQQLKQLDSKDIEDPSNVDKPYNNQFAEDTRNDVINNINTDRTNNGLTPLKIAKDTQQIANQRIQHAVYFYNRYHQFNLTNFGRYVHGEANGEDASTYGTLDGFNGRENDYGENVADSYNRPNIKIPNSNALYHTTTPTGTANFYEDMMMNHDDYCNNGHRKNILSRDVHNLGVATYNYNKKSFVAEEFTEH